MIPISLSEVSETLRARWDGAPQRLSIDLPPVSIDSRTILPGECFIAIDGERFDGHQFVPEALRKGASVILHSRPLQIPDRGETAFLQVEDTTEALKELGSLVRRRWGGRLAAVTGSMGKTTTRRFAALFLGERFEVLQSPGNLNNQYGVPLTLLQLEGRHERAILELGMNRPGEIRELSRISRPDCAAITNVAPVHLEFFDSLDQIAAAKAEILEGLDGTLVYNADDRRVTAAAASFQGTKISFGLDQAADSRVLDFRFEGLDAMRYRLALTPPAGVGGRGSAETFDCFAPFAGRHFLYNIAAAAAIALAEGLLPAEIAAGTDKLEASAMRGRLLRLEPPQQEGVVTILDDSYNSNPAALHSILETVGQVSGYRRRILALGEMLELGSASAQLHRDVGREAAKIGPDFLATVGAEALAIREGALASGHPRDKSIHFPTVDGAVEHLARELRGGDLLVVKGSRGANMDRLIERIRLAWEGRTA